MIRNLKALGLALAAVFAMSAIAASAAQAVPKFTGFETPTLHVHTTVKGTTEAGTVEKFKAGAGTVECHITYEATSPTGEDSTLTVKPTEFKKPSNTEPPDCETDAFGAKFTTHVEFTSCDYEFHAETKIVENEYTGSVDVKCGTVGDEIDVKVTTAGGAIKCTLKIPAQTGLKHIIFTNKKAEKPTDVTANATVEKIKYTQIEGGLLGCGRANGTYEDATYTGQVTLKAFNKAGIQIDAEVSGA